MDISLFWTIKHYNYQATLTKDFDLMVHLQQIGMKNSITH